jgi:hypothetical protein
MMAVGASAFDADDDVSAQVLRVSGGDAVWIIATRHEDGTVCAKHLGTSADMRARALALASEAGAELFGVAAASVTAHSP